MSYWYMQLKLAVINKYGLKSNSHLQKKFLLIYFIESPLKTIKNDFDFILKALFVFKIINFLSLLFVMLKKRLD